VIEVSDDGGEDGDPEDDSAVDTEHDEREVGETFVDDDFHPVEAEISDPVKFLD